MGQTHPIYRLKAVLHDKWRVHSQIRSIAGNRMLFIDWMTLTGAKNFMLDRLKEVQPEGYEAQLVQLAGLHVVIVSKVFKATRL